MSLLPMKIRKPHIITVNPSIIINIQNVMLALVDNLITVQHMISINIENMSNPKQYLLILTKRHIYDIAKSFF